MVSPKTPHSPNTRPLPRSAIEVGSFAFDVMNRRVPQTNNYLYRSGYDSAEGWRHHGRYVGG